MKHILLPFVLSGFIVGCSQVPTQQNTMATPKPQVSDSPTASASVTIVNNPDTNSSADPVVSASPMVTASPSVSITANPSSIPTPLSSLTASISPETMKYLVSTTFSSSSLQSEGKSISVVVTDFNSIITTSSLPVTGGELSIPTNVKTIIFYLLNSSKETISTSVQYLNSGSVTTSAQVNFTRPRASNSGGGGGGSSSSGSGSVQTPVKTVYSISTIAGGGSPSQDIGDDGLATSAKLDGTFGVAVDSVGNIYIADTFNNRIRKVDKNTGKISTIAGGGSPNQGIGDDELATSAKLNTPNGVAVDKDGNIYIADTDNHRIRKVDKNTGKISTIAGTGDYGNDGDDGPATSAKLNTPNGVAVDKDGNVYIADTFNQKIRKVDTSGKISTIAGTGDQGSNGDGGLATSAQLDGPTGVAVDSVGNIYIADIYNQKIRKVDTSGKISTIAGTGDQGSNGDGGLATSAQLDGPTGVAVDSIGNIYFSNTYNNRIRKVDTSGKISTIAGTGDQGSNGDGGLATSAQLDGPTGVAVDSVGNIYIADTNNSRIRKLN